VEYVSVQFSRLRLADDLPRFVKTLQGKSVGGQTPVRIYPIRCKTHGLSRDLHGFLILPLLVVHDAQIAVRSKILWVALNLLLICLGRFIQFSGYISIVLGVICSFSRSLACPATGMLWSCIRSLARPRLAEIRIVNSHCRVAHGKIWTSPMAR